MFEHKRRGPSGVDWGNVGVTSLVLLGLALRGATLLMYWIWD